MTLDAIRIKLMPAQLANQIAAGEVVERPASVVKELLENSLDAGATQIHIDLEHAGIERVRIRDNGCGIIKDDLMLALSRHATSKISHPDDLQAINSLGFRGEALASIAAVAEVRLTSKTPAAAQAWCLQYSPTQLEPTLEPAAHLVGTTIDVQHLFFNVPARRKFLRSDRTELGHIETIVKQIALSRPDIQLTLKHQQNTLLNVRAASNEQQTKQRIGAICGQPFIDKALQINFADDKLRLHGWLGLADTARSQSDAQYFFVNGRIVRDKILNHAVKMAYQDLIPEGRYPCYVLYFELPHAAVDVNVHPTKHEVRFYESRQIHDFIVFHLERALHNGIVTETLTTDNPPVFLNNITPVGSPFAATYTIQEKPAAYQTAAQLAFYAHAFDKETGEIPALSSPTIGLQVVSSMFEAEKIDHDKPTSPAAEFKLIGLLKQDYLLAEIATGLLILDIKIALQLLAYTAMENVANNKPLISQPLLLPTAFSLSHSESETLETKQSGLQKFGIILTRVNEQRWLIRELPMVLKSLDIIPGIMSLVNGKIDQQHTTFCLQFSKLLQPVAGFNLTVSAQTALLDQVLPLDWQNTGFKAGKLIKWHEL